MSAASPQAVSRNALAKSGVPFIPVEARLCERSLPDFIRQAWPIIEPTRTFLTNWHIDLLADYLLAATKRQIRKLIINIPPRYCKSIESTVMWPDWVWAQDPALMPTAGASTRWVFVSYASSLSLKHAVDRRTILDSEWYRRHWGHRVNFTLDQNEKAFMQNTARGYMISTSVSGRAMGLGGDFILVDDPQNTEEVESAAERKNAINFVDGTLATRLDDKFTGVTVLVQQRLHVADVTAHLLKQGGWELCCLPITEPARRVIVFPLAKEADGTPRQVVREKDELLWPQREGPEQVQEARTRLGVIRFRAQYGQQPIPAEGNIFKLHWWNYYTVLPTDRVRRIIQSIDSAAKAKTMNDESCILTAAELFTDFGFVWYLIDCWHERVEYPELKRVARTKLLQYRPSEVLVEDSSSGQELIQEFSTLIAVDEFQNPIPVIVTPVTKSRDKMAYAIAASPTVENGRVALPEYASWVSDFKTELADFSAESTVDNQVDAFTQLINYCRSDVAQVTVHQNVL